MKQPTHDIGCHAYALPTMSLNELATARAAMRHFIEIWFKTRKYGTSRSTIREAINVYRKLCSGRIA